jgi:hypothetical protein
MEKFKDYIFTKEVNEGIIDNIVKSIGSALGYNVKIEKGFFRDILDGAKIGINAAKILAKTEKEIISTLKNGKDLPEDKKKAIADNCEVLLKELRDIEGINLGDLVDIRTKVSKEAKKFGFEL